MSDIKISVCPEESLGDMLSVWKTCFGDSEEYINMFLSYAAKNCTCVTARHFEKAVSMLFLIDSEVISGGREMKAAYLYAAATLPEYRGQGIMGEMIAFSAELMRSRGKDFIILSPAEKSLFDFYERFGFKTHFSRAVYEIEFSGREIPAQLSEKELSAQERSQFLKNSFHVRWGSEFLGYAQRENRFFSGETLMLGSACAFARKDEDCVLLYEVYGENCGDIADLAEKAMERFACKRAVLYLPQFFKRGEAQNAFNKPKIIKNGMALSLSGVELCGENGYLGLTLE